MKQIISAGILAAAFTISSAQSNYITQNGYISFYSHTPIEDISADNNAVGSIINTETGEMVFTLQMTDFQFEKKLMQQHFNENYVESDKFPTSTFKGAITNNEQVDYATPGVYPVSVEGDLTIHGVTKRIQTPGTIEVTGDGLKASSKFIVEPAHYDIKIPGIVRNKIAREMEVTVKMEYTPME
jgi:polyisoprenoid-binding protein YceI